MINMTNHHPTNELIGDVILEWEMVVLSEIVASYFARIRWCLVGLGERGHGPSHKVNMG